MAIDIAKKINGEIVNADSMQVYKEINILSARPDKNKIKHHLYGFLSIKKSFSTGAWLKKATVKIKEINKRGKVALVVGGTGLYFKALIDGFSYIPKTPKPKKNFQLKKSYLKKHYNIFKDIPINDNQRLQRAFLVHKWKTYKLLAKKKRKPFNSDEFVKVYLNPPKSEIREKIKKDF